MMKTKDKIETYFRTVKREGIEKLTTWLNDTDFYTAPASTQYHSNYEGGLAEHSLKVTELFGEKCKQFNVNIPQESIYICGLCHDLCKINFYTKGFKNVKEGKKTDWKGREVDNWIEKEVWEVNDSIPIGHGEKSIILLQRFISLSEFEVLAIRWHMGIPSEYMESKAYQKAVEMYPSIVLLHSADLESSYLLEETKK